MTKNCIDRIIYTYSRLMPQIELFNTNIEGYLAANSTGKSSPKKNILLFCKSSLIKYKANSLMFSAFLLKASNMALSSA